jgi:anti-sigma B factor antagonist
MSTGTAPPGAGLTSERFADHTVIAVRGELDIASAPSLRERLRTALRDTGVYVIIDLSGVTFCDASGLALLVDARRRTEATGAAVVLVGPRPQPARLLQVTGLERAFTVRSSVTKARTTGPGTRSAAA